MAINIGPHFILKEDILFPDILPDYGSFQFSFDASSSKAMFPRINTAGLASFRTRAGLRRGYLHACVIQNFATTDLKTWRMSINSLRSQRKVAAMMGLRGIVTHIGSYKDTFEGGFAKVVQAMKEVAKDQSNVLVLLENSAGAKNSVGGRLETVRNLLDEIGDPRFKMCVDTAHLYACNGIGEEELKELEKSQPYIDLYHWNQTAVAPGSHKDQHAACAIELGHIQPDTFKAIVKMSRPDTSYILERDSMALNNRDLEVIRKWELL